MKVSRCPSRDQRPAPWRHPSPNKAQSLPAIVNDHRWPRRPLDEIQPMVRERWGTEPAVGDKAANDEEGE